MVLHDRKFLRAVIFAAIVTAPATSANIVTIDQFGLGTQDRFPQYSKLDLDKSVMDPIWGKRTLIYQLPFGATNGEAFVFDSERPSRFSDARVPTSAQPAEPQASAQETVNETNAAAYTRGNDQLGHSGFAVTNQFHSDGSSVPEPGFWPLIVFALGGLAAAFKWRNYT